MNNYIDFSLKLEEYYQKVKEIKRDVLQKDYFKFSDGTLMYAWVKNINENKDELTIEQKEQLGKIEHLFKEFEKIKEEENHVIFMKRAEEYLNKTLELKRCVRQSDKCKFSDGLSMIAWYNNAVDKLKRERINNIEAGKKRMEEIMMLATIQDKINTFLKKEKTIEKDYLHERTMERANLYLEKVLELKRNLKESDNLCFEDGINMRSWYNDSIHNIKRKYGFEYIKDNFDTFIKRLYLSGNIKEKEMLEEVNILYKIYYTIKELTEENLKNNQIINHNIFIERAEEYLEKIIEIKRGIKKYDNFTFSDNSSMYEWMASERRNLLRERKQEITPNNERVEELILLAKIQYILDKYEREEKNKKDEMDLNKNTKRIEEYLEKIIELNRNVKELDNLYFEDGTLMHKWFYKTSRKLNDERKSKKKITESRLNEIMMIAKIYDKLYEFSKNNKITNQKHTMFMQKAESYLKMVKKLNRDINLEDELFFEDGVNMRVWFNYEVSKLRKKNLINQKSYREKMDEIMMIANIYNEIYDIQSNLNIDTEQQLFIKKCNEYMEKLKELQRNININDTFLFTDGTNMYRWYMLEYKKYLNSLKIKKINVDIKERQEIFNKVYELSKKYMWDSMSF